MHGQQNIKSGKFDPVPAMKAYRGVEVQLQSFLTSALYKSGQLHAPVASAPGKELLYPLNSKLGGPQGRSERFEE